MVDFATATPTYSVKRNYAPISDIADFKGLKETLRTDESMGLASIEFVGESYKGVKNILNASGDVIATMTVESKYGEHYSDIFDSIHNNFAETNGDDNWTAVEDTDKRNWKFTFKGETADGDPFRILIDESYAQLSGYHLPATLALFETWADAQTELSQEPTA